VLGGNVPREREARAEDDAAVLAGVGAEGFVVDASQMVTQVVPTLHLNS
jgi:hypothetical protein